MSQKRTQRKDSPFTKEQEAWVILQYGLKRSIVAVKRDFRKEYNLQPRNVPDRQAFGRLVSRFNKSYGQVRPAATGGRNKGYGQQEIDRVTHYFQEDDTKSIRQAVRDLNLNFSTIWRILKKELKWKSYRERHVQPLN